MVWPAAAQPLSHARGQASLFSKTESCPTTGLLMLGLEPLLAGIVFREPDPATNEADLM